MQENSTSENLAYKLDGYCDPPHKEVIHGKVVLMAPARLSHNRVSFNIALLFHKFLEGKPCEYFPDGNGLFLSEEEQYEPDGMVVCDPDKAQDKGIVGTPDLVVEVLSRSTSRYDRGHKMDVYEKFGVREYWIVSPAERSVEQYVLDGGKFYLVNTWQKVSPSVWEDMVEEERAAIETEFPCFIFPELTVKLDDVFGKLTV